MLLLYVIVVYCCYHYMYIYIYICIINDFISLVIITIIVHIYIYIYHPYIISSADKTSMQSPLDLRHPACQRTLRSVKTHGGSLRFRTSHDWRIISHVRLDHDHYDHVVWSTVFEWKSNDACIGYLQMGWLLSKWPEGVVPTARTFWLKILYPFVKWIVTCSTDHPDHPDRFRAVQAVKHKPWVELSAFLESSNPGLLWLDVPHQDVIVWR